MIERYTLPEMARIWSEENVFQKWLEIEIVTAEVMADLGQIPKEAAKKIRANAKFSIERIHEIEKRTRHDMLAFLEAVNENLGDESKYLHMGLTSSDVKDTATSLLLKEAGEQIIEELKQLRDAIAEKALEHKDTLMVGRTHGVHGEPITFGLKLAVWFEEIKRQIKRMEDAVAEIAVGQLSGAVGTYANIDPKVEEMVCERLDLKPAPISTQIIQRDRHAFFLSVLANIASSLDKFATEIRNLQRTDLLEVEEAFKKGQKGSSAMPHKKNPIVSERISGLSRVVRANAMVGFENMPLWHERDLTHSSAERVILPDSTILVHYMVKKFTAVIKELKVNKDRMLENLGRTLGLVFSQKVMLALVEKGLLREEAYSYVQSNALKAWEERVEFKQLLLEDERVMNYLTPEELDEIFKYEDYLVHVDTIFRRLGLLS
ncbi:adenylosuccinate lyase [Anoxybacter fermentans]|uniref:Adenylosuccinate lyase n=1 Tax=Anoxybacter fermentans TaxID=1323375 RepID=A0A3S9T1F7_9FIRM|nr:adenylosuccinate lyase [Anoxybacter fermentans]AZR74252.1 adenylosuccinate lyase [Anoxybacter fermentans]